MGKKGLNIYHRKDGRWEGRYKNGFRADGKSKYCSVYAKSYSEAKEKLAKIIYSPKKPLSLCLMTAEKLFDEWLEMKKFRVKISTYENYNFKISKHLLSAFGSVKISNISPKTVYDFINDKLNEGLSEKYISDMIIILKSMMKYASKKYRFENPISDVQLPKKIKSEMKLYSKNEQDTLKNELSVNIDRTKMGVMICMFTGIRIGELCALQSEDIDLENNILNVKKTCQRVQISENKTTKLIISAPKSISSVRSIPLPKFLADILKVFVPSNDKSYLLSGTDKITEPRTMQYRFQKILKKADLPPINFHSLRHIFATNCIEKGFDVKTLSEILGHGTVELTLNRYVHSSMNRKRECMDIMFADMD